MVCFWDGLFLGWVVFGWLFLGGKVLGLFVFGDKEEEDEGRRLLCSSRRQLLVSGYKSQV